MKRTKTDRKTIEARIGELLPSGREEPQGLVHDTPKDHGKFSRKLPEDISPKRLQVSRTIARHPEAIAEVIREAESGERPEIVGFQGPAGRKWLSMMACNETF